MGLVKKYKVIMMNNIKDYRKEELGAYVIGNILVALIVLGCLTPETIKDGTLTTLISPAIISSIIYIYVFILDSVVPANWKDKLVYAFTGRPGDTIFSKIRSNDIDSRFTKKDATTKYEDIYNKIDSLTSEKEKCQIENSFWYSIYKRLEEKPLIYISQRDFLLNRDMCFMTINIAIVYLLASLVSNTLAFSWRYLAFLCIEFLLTNLAARGRAKKFVLNVIASDIYIFEDENRNREVRKD